MPRAHHRLERAVADRATVRALVATLAFVVALLVASRVTAAEGDSGGAGDPPTIEMQRYLLGFLWRGESWSAEPTPEAREIGAAHMANIRRLAEEGKLLIAGPFLDAGSDPDALAGLFIFTSEVATREDAEALCATDPAVQAGRFRIEVKEWYGPAGLTYRGHEAAVK